MMRFKFAIGCILSLFLCCAQLAHADDKPYKEGTVWQITFIKIKPGMFDVYMADLLPKRKKIFEESHKAGLVVSEKLLSGDAFGQGDFDLILMTEYKNFAAFDGLSDKFDVIMAKVIGNQDAQVKTMVKRTETREIIGSKVMQELSYK